MVTMIVSRCLVTKRLLMRLNYYAYGMFCILLCSPVVDLFKKANLILKHAIFFTFGEMLVYRGFAQFTVYQYRFELRAAPAVNFYFFCAIQLLIITTMLMYNCDLIATLVEFIRTKRYHYSHFKLFNLSISPNTELTIIIKLYNFKRNIR